MSARSSTGCHDYRVNKGVTIVAVQVDILEVPSERGSEERVPVAGQVEWARKVVSLSLLL